MEWYQAHRCSDRNYQHEYMFGRKVGNAQRWTLITLELTSTSRTYKQFEHDSTWNYELNDVKLIYKGG